MRLFGKSPDGDWKLTFNEDETKVHFREINSKGEIIREFALEPWEYGRLYYALKDWYGDQ